MFYFVSKFCLFHFTLFDFHFFSTFEANLTIRKCLQHSVLPFSSHGLQIYTFPLSIILTWFAKQFFSRHIETAVFWVVVYLTTLLAVRCVNMPELFAERRECLWRDARVVLPIKEPPPIMFSLHKTCLFLPKIELQLNNGQFCDIPR